MMPPARCTSSMWTSLLAGATLQSTGTLRRQRVDVVHGEVELGLVGGGEDVQHGVGRAAHGDVERHGVLERLLGGDRARQRRLVVLLVVALGEVDDQVRRPRTNRRLRSAWVASVEPLPGSARPSASVRQFIELAVNMPEQEPQVGQAERSIDCDVLVGDLVVGRGDHGVDRGRAPAACRRRIALPASIGPPETKTVGMFSRSAAISMPGVILSQLEMQTMASAQCALTMYSTRVGDQLARRAASRACRRGPWRCRRRRRWC